MAFPAILVLSAVPTDFFPTEFLNLENWICKSWLSKKLS